MSKNAAKEAVIEDILNISSQYQSTSSNIYRKYGNYSESVIQRLFGSWRNAVIECGAEVTGKTYGIKEIKKQVACVFYKYGFISKALIDDECDFSYQAIRPYYKNKNEISKMLGVNNAFCDKLSSKAEVLYLILKDLYQDTIREKTWDWLVNDKTKKPLWVDFFIPCKNIAVEFDGKQHFEYVQRFHNTYKGFLESVYRDTLKDKLLAEHGIKLIRVTYKDRLSKTFITNILDN